MRTKKSFKRNQVPGRPRPKERATAGVGGGPIGTL